MSTRQIQQNTGRTLIIQELIIILQPWIVDEEAASINDSTDLISQFGIDSVAIMQMVLGIEQKFNIRINDYELDTEVFTRAGNFIDMIESKINEAN